MAPFLLCIGSLERPINFYLITEQTFVRLGSDFAHAFTVLFCFFFSFHVQYPVYIRQLYNFFEQCVFNVVPLKSTSVMKFCTKLNSQ